MIQLLISPLRLLCLSYFCLDIRPSFLSKSMHIIDSCTLRAHCHYHFQYKSHHFIWDYCRYLFIVIMMNFVIILCGIIAISLSFYRNYYELCYYFMWDYCHYLFVVIIINYVIILYTFSFERFYHNFVVNSHNYPIESTTNGITRSKY